MLTKPVSMLVLAMAVILSSVGCSAASRAKPNTTVPTPANASQVAAGPQGVPVFQPATNVIVTEQVLNFNTTGDLAAVSQFYIDQMPKLGWSPVGDPYVADTVAKITFSKNGKIADIGIAFDAKSQLTTIGILVQ